MRTLALDHFFRQDLEAIRIALQPGDTLDVIPYQALRRMAVRVFPAAAFTGVERAFAPDMAESWRRYEPIVDRFADWVVAAYRPNVFVVPSDVFFYLRPMITRLRGLGIPTVVVQKETTISPMVMEVHATEVGRSVPFMSDLMTVCSDRHRDFWLRSGAPPEKIRVTGQPRFDGYRSAPPSSRAGALPRLLYLSYDDVAYLPADLGGAADGSTWRQLRRETEEVLAAASADWHITAKRHPSQPASDDWLGKGVDRAAQDADTPTLILDSDVVVGFQTTALLEAALAGRRVLYAAWGETYEASRELLIPYDSYAGAVSHVRSPDELGELLRGEVTSIPRPTSAGIKTIEAHLGPTDGLASQRVVSLLRSSASSSVVVPTIPTRRVRMGTIIGLAGRLVAVVGRLAKPVWKHGGRVAARLGGELRQRGVEAALIRKAGRSPDTRET
jgi:hypothetical protein